MGVGVWVCVCVGGGGELFACNRIIVLRDEP